MESARQGLVPGTAHEILDTIIAMAIISWDSGQKTRLSSEQTEGLRTGKRPGLQEADAGFPECRWPYCDRIDKTSSTSVAFISHSRKSQLIFLGILSHLLY